MLVPQRGHGWKLATNGETKRVVLDPGMGVSLRCGGVGETEGMWMTKLSEPSINCLRGEHQRVGGGRLLLFSDDEETEIGRRLAT